MGEVFVGPCRFESVAGLPSFFPGSVHSLGGFVDAGLPDADLVLADSVADDVRADAPVVVLEGGLEDGVVHVVVAGEGRREPHGHGGDGGLRVFAVSGGEQGVAVDGESLSFGPFCLGLCPLYEPNEPWFDSVSLVVGDLEARGLALVLVEAWGADGGVFW